MDNHDVISDTFWTLGFDFITWKDHDTNCRIATVVKGDTWQKVYVEDADRYVIGAPIKDMNEATSFVVVWVTPRARVYVDCATIVDVVQALHDGMPRDEWGYAPKQSRFVS